MRLVCNAGPTSSQSCVITNNHMTKIVLRIHVFSSVVSASGHMGTKLSFCGGLRAPGRRNNYLKFECPCPVDPSVAVTQGQYI